jgi:hypothetical protein
MIGPQQVREKLLRIMGIDTQPSKSVAGISYRPESVQNERACWLDGDECPYGRPEGQFLLRPRHFCRPSGDESYGCRKIDDNIEDLEDLLHSLITEEMENLRRAIKAELERATTRLSDQVRNLANGVDDSLVKGLIELVAEWIKENGDGEIISPDDLDLDNLV